MRLIYITKCTKCKVSLGICIVSMTKNQTVTCRELGGKECESK